MIFVDTHVLVWLATGDPRLPPVFRDRILDGEAIGTSAVVAAEYSELHRRGRLGEGLPFSQVVEALTLYVQPLPADTWQHLQSLPFIHHDPIDRMLIAHVLASEAMLATADLNMRRYPVPLAW